jgi:transcription initiation factor IIF auxiliary subunit
MEIAQDYRYKGNDWWYWSVWIEGDDGELNNIDHVIYYLHSTFPNPRRSVSNRGTKFRLETGGWGVFPLQAKVVNKDGSELMLKHYLRLEYPDGTPTTA